MRVSACRISQSHEWTLPNFSGDMGRDPRTNHLDFGGDPAQNPDLGLLHPDHDPDPGLKKNSLFTIAISTTAKNKK